MNFHNKSSRNVSTLTKMQQGYWETKQAVRRSLGDKEESCIISSDAELDVKLEFLEAADELFNTLLNVLTNYQEKLGDMVNAEDEFGLALHNFGLKDTSEAGKLMCHIGKSLNCAARQKSSLRVPLMKLKHNVETFQSRATVDAYMTVERMEKARKAYRSGLMWMKKASGELDPDVPRKLKKFRKVQAHVKNLKNRFDRLKLETMHKIDLLLFSRCNLFSQTLVLYQNAFCKMCKNVTNALDSVIVTIPYYKQYTFQTVKELNVYLNSSAGAPQNVLVPSRAKCPTDIDESHQENEESLSLLKSTIKPQMKKRFPSYKQVYKTLPLINLEDNGVAISVMQRQKTRQEDSNELDKKACNILMSSPDGQSTNLYNQFSPQASLFVRDDRQKVIDAEYQNTLKLFDPLFKTTSLLEDVQLEEPQVGEWSTSFDQKEENARSISEAEIDQTIYAKIGMFKSKRSPFKTRSTLKDAQLQKNQEKFCDVLSSTFVSQQEDNLKTLSDEIHGEQILGDASNSFLKSNWSLFETISPVKPEQEQTEGNNVASIMSDRDNRYLLDIHTEHKNSYQGISRADWTKVLTELDPFDDAYSKSNICNKDENC